MGAHTGAGDLMIVNWAGIDYDIITAAWTPTGSSYDGVYHYRHHGDDGKNRIDFTGVERFDLTLGSGADDIRTGDGADAVRGGLGNDVLRTGAGADTVNGGGGLDAWAADKSAATVGMTINLNAASSSYMIGAASGSVAAVEFLGLNSGTEKFSTGSGDDVITTQDAGLNDYMATNGGADTVTLAGGRDWLDMGPASDTLIIDWSDLTYDMITAAGFAAGANGYSGIYHYRHHGDDGKDRADFFGVDTFDLTLGSGSDVIYTGDGTTT